MESDLAARPLHELSMDINLPDTLPTTIASEGLLPVSSALSAKWNEDIDEGKE